jgi:CRISPR/Cas system-associated exonuclease Cas4 (RecB family)
MTYRDHIRPSALPKLDAQPCFVGAGGEASAAAQRGTAMDKAWRALLSGNFGKAEDYVYGDNQTLTTEDWDSVVWAAEEAKRICGEGYIETSEGRTQFQHPLFANPFTADGVCFDRGIILDLKTGQLRSYKAQLAAYCLALMTETWTQRASGVAIFCDQRETVHYDFTYAEAKGLVEDIINRTVAREVNDYTPGDYCGWCKYADTCPARVQPAKDALAVVESLDCITVTSEGDTLSNIREAILADPARLGAFWAQYKLFEKEIAKPVGEAMRERLDAGAEIPGWKIRYDAGREFFDWEALWKMSAACTPEELITLMGGKVSGRAFREFCAVRGLAVPEQLARSGAPIAKLMPEKPKKAKAIKAGADTK